MYYMMLPVPGGRSWGAAAFARALWKVASAADGLGLHISICLSYLSTYLSTYLSFDLSTYLSIYVSTYLAI